jgi:hypothetical protein
MRRSLAHLIVPAALVVGSLGVATSIASASTTRPAVVQQAKAQTWSGKVKTLDAAKKHFTFTSGKKTYTVDWSTKTTFKDGKATGLKAGATVSVTGTLKGTVITATSIKL